MTITIDHIMQQARLAAGYPELRELEYCNPKGNAESIAKIQQRLDDVLLEQKAIEEHNHRVIKISQELVEFYEQKGHEII